MKINNYVKKHMEKFNRPSTIASPKRKLKEKVALREFRRELCQLT